MGDQNVGDRLELEWSASPAGKVGYLYSSGSLPLNGFDLRGEPGARHKVTVEKIVPKVTDVKWWASSGYILTTEAPNRFVAKAASNEEAVLLVEDHKFEVAGLMPDEIGEKKVFERTATGIGDLLYLWGDESRPARWYQGSPKQQYRITVEKITPPVNAVRWACLLTTMPNQSAEIATADGRHVSFVDTWAAAERIVELHNKNLGGR